MKKLIQLAKMLLRLAEIKTDKGVLIVEGELEVGSNVADEEGNNIEDGEYVTEDGKIIVVAESKVAEIKDAEKPAEEPKQEEPVDAKKCGMEGEEPVEEPKEDPAPDEKDLKIAELEALLEEKDKMIEELTEKVKELEAKIGTPVEEPVEMKAQVDEKAERIKQNPALKYFV